MASRKKKKKYDDERMHFLRALALVILVVGFVFSAIMSVYAFVKTKEIVQHPDIYRKQRDYKCSDETVDQELVATGTRQLLTPSMELLDKSRNRWSGELNNNPNFKKSNPYEPELPAGYRNVSVGSASGNFLHDKFNHSLQIFANIPDGTDGQAGWYMDYFGADSTKQYIFKTSYILNQAKSTIIAEEVDSGGNIKYTDLVLLEPTKNKDKVDKTILFVPLPSTVKMRFYSQLTSMGSMNIFEESVHSIDGMGLAEPLITVSFDDGWSSVHTAAKPILDELKIKTTQSIIADSFRSLLSGYMNLGEVKQFEKEGHEIASHSVRHCNLARLSNENLEYDIKASKLLLESEFGSIRGLAYPYGSYNQHVEDVAKTEYDYIRTTMTGYNGLLMDRHELRSITINPEMTMDEFRSMIDLAIKNHLWVNIIYHKVGEAPDVYGITPAALREQLTYLKTKSVRIVTTSHAVDIISKQQNERFGKFLP